jgi:hypothetical protein
MSKNVKKDAVQVVHLLYLRYVGGCNRMGKSDWGLTYRGTGVRWLEVTKTLGNLSDSTRYLPLF